MREVSHLSIIPRVSAYLQDRGFNYPKAAVLVVVCPLAALIDVHLKDLKDYANLANTKIIAARFAAKKTRKGRRNPSSTLATRAYI